MKETHLSYYVKVATRSSKAATKGSPAQAMEYLTDGHDEGLEPSLDPSEVDYITRAGEGKKTRLEGGRQPLYGHGKLKGMEDSPELCRAFQEACNPVDRRGTTGYKSITMTVPKEVSLFLEAHRERGREAMQRAFDQAIQKMYPEMKISGVAATHTRNSNGEVHWHNHGLVSKFAERKSDGRILSLNGKAVQEGANPVMAFKAAWKEAVESELKKEFGITVSQVRSNGPAKIVTAEGITLPPLNRETRRQLEKALEPTITLVGPDGQARISKLKLNEMHSRIYSVAMKDKGRGGWSVDGFIKMYPDHKGKADTYNKMADRLKTFGYLTPEGRATHDFKNHATAKWGNQLTPELFRLRMELANAAQAQSKILGKPVQVPTLSEVASGERIPLWERVEKLEAIRNRIEYLGYSAAEIKRIEERARQVAPTIDQKRTVSDKARSEFLTLHKGEALERVKHGESGKGSIFSAFVDLQKAKIQRTYLDLAGVVRPDYYPRKVEATKIVQGLEKEMATRKAAALVRNETLAKAAIFGRELLRSSNLRRPVSYVFSRASSIATRRLDRAKTLVTRVASWQETKAADREALLAERGITGRWKKEYLEKPLADLKAQAEKWERPEQAKDVAKLQALRASYAKLGQPEPEQKTIAALANGIMAMGIAKIPAATRLEQFKGKEADLAKAVYLTAFNRDLNPGSPVPLDRETFEAARQAKVVGDRLVKEHEAMGKVVEAVPSNHVEMAKEIETLNRRLEVYGIKSPITSEKMGDLAPLDTAKELERARLNGILSEGPAWATKRPSEVKEFASTLEKDLDLKADQSRGLEDQLINRRFQA